MRCVCLAQAAHRVLPEQRQQQAGAGPELLEDAVAELTGDYHAPLTTVKGFEAVTQVDHRELGMTWSPLGILRGPGTLVVRGRLVREEGAQR